MLVKLTPNGLAKKFHGSVVQEFAETELSEIRKIGSRQTFDSRQNTLTFKSVLLGAKKYV